MNINKTGRVESKHQLEKLTQHYKEVEGYNSCIVASRNKITGAKVSVSHYWAVDFFVFDPNIITPVRYKILYVGNPATFAAWQREIEEKIDQAKFKPLEIKHGPETVH